MPNADAVIAALPKFLGPQLRLFLSVDIVNSTAFKQSMLKDRDNGSGDSKTPLAEQWFMPINKFYREVERSFSEQWGFFSTHIQRVHQWEPGPAPELWKAAGDELIYVKTLTDHRQALVCLGAWIEAINSHRKAMREEHSILDLKASAWLAGFPVNNAEVILRSRLNPEATDTAEGDAVLSNLSLLEKFDREGQISGFRDFIGPSIDTGFRVAAHATPRKLVITIDLAYILAHAIKSQPTHDFPIDRMEFHYDGRVALKGVLDGSPYPLFWIAAQPLDDLQRLEDGFLKSNQVELTQVREFCELFIEKQAGRYITRPFIIGDKDPRFQDVPSYHVNRLKQLSDYFQFETQKRKDELKQLAGEAIEENGAPNHAPPIADPLLRAILHAIHASAVKKKP